jgi:hypothetical protein
MAIVVPSPGDTLSLLKSAQSDKRGDTGLHSIYEPGQAVAVPPLVIERFLLTSAIGPPIFDVGPNIGGLAESISFYAVMVYTATPRQICITTALPHNK